MLEISGLEEGTDYVSCADLGERYWVLLTGVFHPDEEESTTQQQQAADAPDDGMEPDGEYSLQLVYVNPKTAKAVRSVSLEDCPLEDAYGVKFDEAGDVIVYNEYEKKCVRYSPALERIGEVEAYRVPDAESKRDENALTDDVFSAYDSFSHDYIEYGSAARVNCFAFYDDNESLYFADSERFSPCAGYQKAVFGNMIEDDVYAPQTLRIYDFATRLIINEIQTPDFGEKKSVSLISAVLRNESLFVCLEEGGNENEPVGEQSNFQNHYYIWNYRSDACNKPFQSVKKDAAQIRQDNEQLCVAIKNDYGIDVLVNQPNQSTLDKDEVYALDLTATDYKVYTSLVGIRCFLLAFPDGFIRQMYTGLEHLEKQGFEIYLAKCVVGYPGAYANMWQDKLEIALGTDGFSIETLAHEFMHVIDARIEDYYWEPGFDSVWSEYNPKDFSYLGYEGDNAEAWEDVDWEDYEGDFCTYYALSSAAEDRADTFASLFENGFFANIDEAPYWYQNGTNAAKKAVFLCHTIRTVFPCMQEAPVQVWEKFMDMR